MDLLIDFVLIGGIFATLLILFLLIKSEQKALPQKLLVIFFTTLCCFLLNSYAENHNIAILFVLTFLLSFCIEVLLGPLIYLYIKSLFEDNKSLLKKNWLHFIPLVLHTIFLTIPMLIYIFKEEYPFSYFEYLNENSDYVVAALMLYLLFYLLISLKLFHKYRNAMQLNYSSIDESNFRWVKKMLIGAIIISCIELFIDLYEIFVTELQWQTANITLISVIIWIAYLGYYGINQTKVLLPDFLIKKEPLANSSKEKTNVPSSLTPADKKVLETRLENILRIDKPYLDEDLTLGKLAKMVDTTDKKLSGFLNQEMKTTFYDLINTYRVEAVKNKLGATEYENLTLLGIAYECGFKSKTSFNRIFKRETGLSPSEYKKTL
ncbi:helix-turn-helix domain-containing protein [Maribacter algarum]|uniref:Helix-turn-helix domain-containing protein n=1 Tax=Maribacter algarum (ex Zhang et al. 2020) TaxID=2578118 RepID=A0A5S3PSD1_9FLAO|nr:helix-turn-helix domain-containing protein [Maribacter algarum]TMM57916.1 helix-turn-helix domain-containing protein [Maribacter algarum]